MYSLITDDKDHFYTTTEPERLLAELWRTGFGLEFIIYGPGQWEGLYPQLARH